MVSSAATNAEQYLAQLPEDRRAVMTAVRKLIRRNLPKGYVETMAWGMICYVIPLEKYPETYNGEPLVYLGLASQKNNYALYMTGSYGDPQKDAELRAAFKAAGKKLDMGKACLRFRDLDDLELEAVAKAIAGTPPKRYIELYEAARANTRTGRKAAAKKATAKKKSA
jgi:hypothetical protein